MTQPKPPTQDTAPPEIRKLAEDCLMSEAFSEYLDGRDCAPCAAMEQLCRCPVPEEWIDALAGELDAAISDRQGEWLETLIAGRPYDTPLVEWEHRELVDIDDAKEIAANQGHRYG